MRLAILFSLISFWLIPLGAQDISKVIESEYPFSSGTKHVFQVEVSKANIDQFKTAVNSGLKTYKSKLKSVKGADEEYYVEDVNVPDISHQSISLLYKFQQLADGARMMVHIRVGEEVINSESEASLFESALEYPDRIGGRVSVMLLNLQLEEKNDLLSDEKKKLDELTENKLEIETEINESNNAILMAEEGIESNKTKIESIQTEIELRSEDMQGFQMELASVDVKAYESQIKSHEKEISSLNKEIEKINSNIAGSKADQAGLESEMSLLDSEIEAKSELISTDPKIAKDVKSLNKDKTKLAEKIRAEEAEQTNMNSQIEFIQTQIETENQAITDIQTKLNEHNADYLEGQIKELESQIKDLSKEKDAIAKDNEKKQEEVYGAKAKISELEMELDSIENAMQAKKEELIGIEADIETIQSRIAQHQ